jgi:predicted RNase H-like nuclease (RuvC/YqgF family)
MTTPSIEDVKNALVHHPITYVIAMCIGSVSAYNAYAEDVKGWVSTQIQYGVALHVAQGGHTEYELRNAKTEVRFIKSEQSALKRTQRDYESRIFIRKGGEATEKTRNEIRYYEEMIEDLEDERHEYDRMLDEARDEVRHIENELGARPFPTMPTESMPVLQMP